MMTAAIFTAEDKHHPIPGLPGLTAAERIVATHWPAFHRSGLPSTTNHSVQAYAEVNHGRWTIRCPWCVTCHNASAEDHRFFCTHCSNGAGGGQWVSVIWPEERDEIETLLGNRPLPEQRNWVPTETVEDLRRENIEHGVVA